MAFTDIIYNKEDGVARITINRPEVYNALRGKTTDEMVVALHDARNDDSIRVVVIAGSGPNAFCSGRDQAEDRSSPEYSGASEEDFMNIIRRLPKPVIAEVDGFAIGSGNILAYMCDFTVASERSTFGQTGPRVGSPAAGFGVGYLASVVGQKRAREIWMLTQQYSGRKAYEFGLANSVVPHEKLRAEVDRYCALIKNNSPVILQLEKITFNEMTEYAESIPNPTDRYARDYIMSEEAEERRLSFIERRPIDTSKNMPLVKTDKN